MFYKKLIENSNPTRVKVKFSNFSGGVNKDIDENLLPFSYAVKAYNLSYKNKALNVGLGFKNLALPNSSGIGERDIIAPYTNVKVLGCWLFRYFSDFNNAQLDYYFIYCDNLKIYYNIVIGMGSPWAGFMNFTYASKPTPIVHKYNDSDCMVLACEDDYLAIWDGINDPVKIANTLNLTSLCIHYERLFASIGGKKNLVRFSDDYDLINWTETAETGGYIELVDERGKINKVISFNDYVYIIRDLGISRLSAYSSQDTFSVTNLYLSSSQIYDKTVAVCGDVVLMLCSDGLYYFTGTSAYKLDLKINDMLVKDYLNKAIACFYNGKYYLACRLDFFDDKSILCENETDYVNNALIEYDIDTETYIITRGVDICNMTPFVTDYMNKLVVCFNGEQSNKIGELTHDGTFFGTPMEKEWASPMTDLGYPDKTKIIRELHVLVKFDCKITVSTDLESKEFLFEGSLTPQRVCPNIKGKLVSLNFEGASEKFYVSNPNLVIDLIDD